MDTVPEQVWQWGSTIVCLVGVIAAIFKFGLPSLINQIEREREFALSIFNEQRAHHAEQFDKLVGEFATTREVLEKRADSWKAALDKVDDSVQAQTAVMQSEMIASREEYARAIKVRDRLEAG